MGANWKTLSRQLVGLTMFNLWFETKTGLLIQMPVQAQAYKIGGADKYPMTTRKKYGDVELEVPYVPGSSVKGRVRSLLELATKQTLYTTDGKIWQYARSLSAMKNIDEFMKDVRDRNVISELFGWASANFRQVVEKLKSDKSMSDGDAEQEAYKAFQLLSGTRLLFSDFFPTSEYVEKTRALSVSDFLEEKPENRIDRVTAAADPRDVVRVKPGVVFEGTVTMLLFDHDKDMVGSFLNTFLSGLELLEATYLGGSGSRGYGRIKFVGKEVRVFRVSPEVEGSSGLISEVGSLSINGLKDLRNKFGDLKDKMQSLYENR
ncbi:MAG: type III-A CRISPR-associated RAMP protein Csm3 [Thermosphaera sp.]